MIRHALIAQWNGMCNIWLQEDLNFVSRKEYSFSALRHGSKLLYIMSIGGGGMMIESDCKQTDKHAHIERSITRSIEGQP